MVILALDYGEKRIGAAITDESGKFTKALDFIPNKSEPKRITSKDFPLGTTIETINKARKDAKLESKIEFKKLCNKLIYLINCYYPNKIIIGIPTTIDNKTGGITFGVQAKKVKTFVKKFETCLKSNGIALDFELIEESMTSKIAEKNLRSLGITTSNKIKEKIDSESARVMLEEYIQQNRI
jgi:RNase H-fold protein (predicted Holliday junction resolvase)